MNDTHIERQFRATGGKAMEKEIPIEKPTQRWKSEAESERYRYVDRRERQAQKEIHAILEKIERIYNIPVVLPETFASMLQCHDHAV